jgi:DNA-binding response OmpR family regulator
MDAKVLVVEDEPTLLETLEYNLTRQGYEVYTAADGLAALEVARQQRPDIVVLDVMLPDIDGFEVCRILRREMNVPILMLTARADEVDKVVGLEVGADDYLTKPFSMRELLARVKAPWRRVRLIREELAAETDRRSVAETNGDVVTNEIGIRHPSPFQPRVPNFPGDCVERAEKAMAVTERDDEVDQLYNQIFRELVTFILEDPRTVTRAMYLLFCAHNLERIADRVTNICERVVFVSTGEMEEITSEAGTDAGLS